MLRHVWLLIKRVTLTKIIFIVFLLALIGSCVSDHSEYGHATALKNGEKWEAAGRAFYWNSAGVLLDDTINFVFTTFSKAGYQRDGLSFFAIPLYLGDVAILQDEKTRKISSASFGSKLDDGHVSGDTYDVIEDHPLNYFELTQLNGETGLVRGNFQLAMVIDTSNGGKRVPSSPDTIFFTDGEFAVYIDE